MNEHQARQVLLVRAIETDRSAGIFSEDDRRHASKAALELARWQADERKQPLAPAGYLIQRAKLLGERLAQRKPRLVRAVEQMGWPRGLDLAVTMGALILGALLEQIGDRSRVNLLAFPLAAIVLWNLAVYAAVALHALGIGHARLSALAQWLAARASHRAAGLAAEAPLFVSFAADWSQRSLPLLRARLARLLHLAAAAFALGAVAALYLRGLVFEYRVGWESTFLDAAAVHGLLATVLAPAVAVTGLAAPTLAEVELLRFSGTGPGAAEAARWVHLYAATVALLVLAPRLVLAAIAHQRVRQWTRRFPLSLEEPYFRRLLAGVSSAPARVRVLPYSYTPDEDSLHGLRRLAQRLYGDDVELLVRPTVAFGAEGSVELGSDTRAEGGDAGMTLVLVSAAATPEHENHGTLLATLTQMLGRAPALLLDEAPYRRRLGGAHGVRLLERRAAWRAFAQAHQVALAALDLTAADETELVAVERDLAAPSNATAPTP